MNKLKLNFSEAFRNLRLSALEWVTLIATVCFVGAVTFFYLNSTQPLRSKLSELRTREKKVQSQIVEDTEKLNALAQQRENREKILDSLGSFEARLHSRKVGITTVIDEVNQLARANRVIAGDISYRSDAPDQLPGEAKPGASPTPTVAPITRRDKLPNVYEQLGVDTTVEGDYADLRRFISALERSRNFVIINSIALQSVDEKQRSKSKVGGAPNGLPAGAPPSPAGGANPGLTPGGEPNAAGPTKTIVSLKIEMETHFAREGKLEPVTTPVPANAPAPRQ